MIRKTDIQNKILENIFKNKGFKEEYYISGCYAYVVNETMEYLIVYYGEAIDGEILITERFFEYDYEMEGTPLQGFFKSTSERVRMNKVRKYVNNYIY